MNLVNNIMYSPLEYARASVLANEAGVELLSRLDWMAIKPKVILDAGCGTGVMSAQLKARYKEALVLALDISDLMVQHVKQQAAEELTCICADTNKLPLSDKVVDLIFANLMLPWCANFDLQLREWRRVLKPNGLLILSALGLDTLQEARNIFNPDDIPQLMDMHDAGDLLLQEKFTDPVLDVNYYTLIYQDQEKLMSEFCHSGMVAASALHKLTAMKASAEGAWPVTYEVIYAHAFAPLDKEEVSAHEDGMIRIPLTHLRRQLK